MNAQKQFDSVQAAYNLSDQEELVKQRDILSTRNKFAAATDKSGNQVDSSSPNNTEIDR